MNSCTFIPNRGVDLFLKLKKDLGYTLGREVFLRSINPKFIEDYKNTLSLDAEGIPSYTSVINNPYIQKFIGNAKTIEVLAKKFEEKDDTMDNYNLLLEEAFNFNKTSPSAKKFVAIVDYTDTGKLKINIVPKSKESIDKFNSQYSITKLNNRIVEIFKPLGVTIGKLTKLEERLGRVGSTDFSRIKDTISGLADIIRVADNKEGVEAISEESSHLVIGILRDTPLITRAINLLANNENLLKQILGEDFQDVSTFYNGNLEMVAEEALGKLLQKNLIKNQLDEFKTHKSFFSRVIDFVKQSLKKISYNAIDRALIDVDSSMGILAKQLLNNNLDITRKDVVNAKRDAQFNALSKRTERQLSILRNALGIEHKRLSILKEGSTGKTEMVISHLQESLSQNEDDKLTYGLIRYAEESLSELQNLKNQFDNLDSMDIDKIYALLFRAKTYVESYGSFIKELNDLLVDEKFEGDNIFDKRFTYNNYETSLNEVLKNLNDLSSKITAEFSRTTFDVLTEFYRPILGDTITLEVKGEGKKEYTIEEILKSAPSDISMFDSLLLCMRDSKDILLQAADEVYKRALDDSRDKTLDYYKRIEALRQKAESYGIKDFEWMFEKDKEGNKTGNYISEIDHIAFKEELERFFNYIDSKYKDNSVESQKAKRQEILEWRKKNTSLTFGPYTPNRDKYVSQTYLNLSNKQKEILKEYKDIKKELDDILPSNRVGYDKAIQDRKTKVERAMTSRSLGDAWNFLKESFQDDFMLREDDDQLFGDTHSKYLDFSNREILTVPTLYTTYLKNPNELSTDVFTSLSKYSYMANKYKAMSDISSPLELTRIIISEERKVDQTRGSNPIFEKIKNQITKNKAIIPTGSNIEKKYQEFLESKIYMRYYKDAGDIKIGNSQFNKTKAVSVAKKYATLMNLGFNWVSDVAGVLNAVAMQNIEVAAGQYFRAKDLARADFIYGKIINDHIAHLNSRNRNDKLSLFDEALNVSQDFEAMISKSKAPNMLRRAFGRNVAYLGAEAGNHWVMHRVAIAMALKTQVKLPNGTITSVWDALQIRNKFEDNNSIKEMYIPEGTTYLDGTEFNIRKFGRKVAKVNHNLMGIYNQEDLSAAHRTILGRLLLMHRNWLVPMFNYRFGSRQTDLLTGEVSEGYYRTFARVLYETAMEFKRGEIQLGGAYKVIANDYNCRRALFEILQFFLVWILSGLLSGDDDDSEDKSRIGKFAELMTARMVHELGGLTPSTTFIRENLKTLQNPLPITSSVNSLFKLINSILTPGDYIDEIQSGVYKGMSTLEKNFLKAPLPVVSQIRQLDKLSDGLEENIKFYLRE